MHDVFQELHIGLDSVKIGIIFLFICFVLNIYYPLMRLSHSAIHYMLNVYLLLYDGEAKADTDKISICFVVWKFVTS